MTRLNAAKIWVDKQLQRLQHIQDLSTTHDQEPHLRPLLKDLLHLTKGRRKQHLKTEREGLYRVALVRMFSSFEADFREAFLEYLRHMGGLESEQLKELMQSSMSVSTLLAVFRSLEPEQFSKSHYGEVGRIREERNRLAHGGFAEDLAVTGPSEVHDALRRLLQILARRVEKASE